ncbi:MAG: RsmB/NOP family class I SAM-dependent RNA methyltransferase [Pseudomonadota bacterium]
MTPGARVAAAIEILDAINAGHPAEVALTRWARRSRFAGSKDRAAIRDHVFDAQRLRPRAAHAGRGTRGRALMIGLLRLTGQPLDALFNGAGHAPAALTPEEVQEPAPATDLATLWCVPGWQVPLFQSALGARAAATAEALQQRAPLSLRVNTAKTTLAKAQASLAEDGIATRVNPLSETALSITSGARRLRQSATYLQGLVELQDAASQAVADLVPSGGRVLDYCAGGGGKTLALAADPTREVFAHDIDPKRMSDLPARAARAGANVRLLQPEELADVGPYDTVLCDAPCSGSGAWRRSPEGKWALTPARLDALQAIQDEILAHAATLTKPEGTLIFATCSVFKEENEDRVAHFLRQNPDWTARFSQRFDVSRDGDGFFTAHLCRHSGGAQQF